MEASQSDPAVDPSATLRARMSVQILEATSRFQECWRVILVGSYLDVRMSFIERAQLKGAKYPRGKM